MSQTASKGTRTIVFTDLESSTNLWQVVGQKFGDFLLRHFEDCRMVAEGLGGVQVKTTGDGSMASFETPSAAVAFAAEVQRLISVEPPIINDRKVRIRIGIHVGEVTLVMREGRLLDLYDNPVNTAARICDSANGGQTHASSDLVRLAGLSLEMGVTPVTLGTVKLKDIDSIDLYRLEFEGIPTHDDPPRVLKANSEYLPPIYGEFVGRGDILDDLETRLVDRTPGVITLFGHGGMGKTRMALELAHRLDAKGKGWIWAPLEQARTEDQFYALLASVLGLDLQANQDHRSMVWTSLSSRSAVLFLDNLEQLDKAGPIVAELLDRTKASIVVTSRHALKIRAEKLLPLPSLSAEEGAYLFESRMRDAGIVQPLTKAGRTAVMEISRRLDGVPLAISLAAARARSMSPAQILDRLNQRFRVLVGDSDDLPERQATLAATIEWSVNLLTEEQKRGLLEACIFPGPFLLPAFEEVSECPVPWGVLEELQLRSLLISRQEPLTDEKSYIVFESVAAYMKDAWPEGEEVRLSARRRLMDYTQRQLSQLSSLSRSASEANAHSIFVTQIHTFQGGVGLALSSSPLAESLTLAADFMKLANATGWIMEAHATAGRIPWDDVLEVPEAPGAGEAALEYAGLKMDQWNFEEAKKFALFALSAFDSRGAKALQGRAHNLIGLIARREKNWPAAVDEYRKALDLFESVGDEEGCGVALCNLGVAATNGAEAGLTWEEALTKSLKLRTKRQDARGMAECMTNLGIAYGNAGDLERALEQHFRSWKTSLRLHDRVGTWRSAANAGEMLGKLGFVPEALACLDYALQGFRGVQSPFANSVEDMVEQAKTSPPSAEGSRRFGQLEELLLGQIGNAG